jgi:hypothetical protein
MGLSLGFDQLGAQCRAMSRYVSLLAHQGEGYEAAFALLARSVARRS